MAGVSVDYLRRLEQGQGRPSRAVLDALARALRLSRAEYEYVCTLAGHAATGTGTVSRRIDPGARRLLDRLQDMPLCVCDAAWTVIEWNAAWSAMWGWESCFGPGRERNVAWRLFTAEPNSTSRLSERRLRAETTIVADLRTAVTRYPADGWLTAMIADLLAASDRFRTVWENGSTARHHDDRLTVRHPDVGDLTLDCDTMTIGGADLRVIVFSAEPNSADAARLTTMLSTARSE